MSGFTSSPELSRIGQKLLMQVQRPASHRHAGLLALTRKVKCFRDTGRCSNRFCKALPTVPEVQPVLNDERLGETSAVLNASAYMQQIHAHNILMVALLEAKGHCLQGSSIARSVIVVPSQGKSPLGKYEDVSWVEVMHHIAKRLTNVNPGFQTAVYTDKEMEVRETALSSILTCMNGLLSYLVQGL